MRLTYEQVLKEVEDMVMISIHKEGLEEGEALERARDVIAGIWEYGQDILDGDFLRPGFVVRSLQALAARMKKGGA